jgi:hypothetical protein
MKLPRWILMWIETLPKNYIGEVHIVVHQNGHFEVERYDKITEKVFRERWKEKDKQLPPMTGESNG